MRRNVAIVASLLAALGIAYGAYAAVAPGHSVFAVEKEFKILPTALAAKPPPPTVTPTFLAKAGKVTFSVKNAGRLKHEFVVLKSSLAPTKLPVKAAKAVLVGKVYGQLKDIAPGKLGTLSVTLPAGKYILLCNLPAHYQAGQRAALVVS